MITRHTSCNLVLNYSLTFEMIYDILYQSFSFKQTVLGNLLNGKTKIEINGKS